MDRVFYICAAGNNLIVTHSTWTNIQYIFRFVAFRFENKSFFYLTITIIRIYLYTMQLRSFKNKLV